MTLSKDSRWLKWAYLFDSKNRPTEKANLCDVFWRSFLGTPILIVTWGVFLSGLLIALWEALKSIWPHKVEVGLGVTFIGLMILCIWLEDRNTFSKMKDSISNSVVVEGVRAIKRRYCPIITLKE